MTKQMTVKHNKIFLWYKLQLGRFGQ